MIESMPVILYIAGFPLLGLEIWATRLNRRISQNSPVRKPTIRAICTSIVGLLFVYCSFIAQYGLGPGIRVFGVPFSYALWESSGGHWLDFTGALTLPALLGNAAVAFLLPQLVVAAARPLERRRLAFTAASLVTTIFVSVALIIINTHHYSDWGGMLRIPLTAFSMACGILINFACGLMAFKLNEHWGRRTALIGIALWFLILFALGEI